jgi:hypothetical protein
MWPRNCGPVSFHERRAGSAASVHNPLRVAINSVVRRGALVAAVFFVEAMESSLQHNATPSAAFRQASLR